MTSIKVATFNMHLTLDRWIQRRSLVVAQLLDVSPDVIALQEVAIPIRQARWLMRQLNARAEEGQKPYRIVNRRRPFPYFAEGLAILSRLPILSSDGISLGFGRTALRANIELPTGETVDLINVHLFSLETGQQAREEQIMRLMGWLDSNSPIQRRVITGCFKAEPDDLSIVKLKGMFGYRSAFELVNRHELLATFPTVLNSNNMRSGVCHDYVFVSPAVKHVISADVCCHKPSERDMTLYPSDHVGLMTWIDLGDA